MAYADDVVLLAEGEEEMRIMGRLEGYLEGKKLELNVGKTKVVRFKRGEGKKDKRVWRWRGKVIEEVKEFKYLGYVMQRSGGQEAQVRERTKKAAALLERVWEREGLAVLRLRASHKRDRRRG